MRGGYDIQATLRLAALAELAMRKVRDAANARGLEDAGQAIVEFAIQIVKTPPPDREAALACTLPGGVSIPTLPEVLAAYCKAVGTAIENRWPQAV